MQVRRTMTRTPFLSDYACAHELMATLVDDRVGTAFGDLPRVVALTVVCIGSGVWVDGALARDGVAIAVLGVDWEVRGLLRAHLPCISFADQRRDHMLPRYLWWCRWRSGLLLANVSSLFHQWPMGAEMRRKYLE